jgi:hypothetical protein
MNKSKNLDALRERERERESHSLNKGGVKYDTSIY